MQIKPLMSFNVRPIEILMVEDNPADRDAAVEMLKKGKIYTNLYSVDSGEEALTFLEKEGQYSDVPRPDLILLDLRLPKMQGEHVLGEIRAADAWRDIPVVIMTTSKEQQDILKAKDLKANCYMVKPVDSNQLIEVVNSIDDFWLTITIVPPELHQP